MQARTPHTPTTPSPAQRALGAIACLLVPGLGLAVADRAWRALAASLAMLTLILGGLLVAGTSAVDRRADAWWFLLQAPAGAVVWTVDALNQRAFKGLHRGQRRLPAPTERVQRQPDPGVLQGTRLVIVPALPDDPPQRWPRASFGRTKEIGHMAIAAAGLLNAVCMLACLAGPRPDPTTHQPSERSS